jgi:hypothetical protein
MRMRNWKLAAPLLLLFAGTAVTLVATGANGRLHWRLMQSAQVGAAAREDSLTFLVTFGYLRESEKDYSGSVSATGGAIRNLESWRFAQGDALNGPSAWKLRIKLMNFENQPNQPTRLPDGTGAPRNIVPAGIFVTVDSSATSVAVQTAQGNFSIPLRDVQYGNLLRFVNGDVRVQRTPGAVRISQNKEEEHDFPSIAVTRNGVIWSAWQAYQDRGDNVYARRATDTQPMKVTEQKGDVYRTSIAEDPAGNIHVVWSERSDVDWNLKERVYSGNTWSATRTITTSATSPNMFHKLVQPAGSGPLRLIWVGYEGGQSYLYLSSYSGSAWSSPQRMSEASVWAPDATTDKDGNLYLAWDSYRDGNYDIFFRRVPASGAPDAIEQVTKSTLFEAHPSLAIDGQGRTWLAWDQSGANWGKDWSHEDMYRSTTLYAYRSIRVAVKDGATWKEGPDFSAAVPDRLRRYWQLPHLSVDDNGRIWALFQIRSSGLNNREDFWCNGGLWDLYLTTLENGVWQPAAMLPDSTSRPETPVQMVAAGSRVLMTWALDGRQFGKIVPGFQGGTMVHYDVNMASASRGGSSGQVQLSQLTQLPNATQTEVLEPNEKEDVARIRGYRTTVGGTEYRILRGDFHRHTEISNDGSGDGSIEDYFRYNLDAASMDTGILTDHNMGGDIEYSWWRTEKSYDLFRIRGRYLPLFGYERSVNYPNGHRNVVFDHRGVRTLPVKADENQGRVNSSTVLYPYLRQNRGICMEHSLATDQGTDWRDNDPELEPLVEIYQGYHAAYEYAGGPRAESDNYHVKIHGPYRPLGFWWNALDKGLLLGVQSSSDHISTHVSYALLITPQVDRTTIVNNMRQRHAYAATSNIVLDFQAQEASGTRHLQGDWIEKTGPIRLTAKIMGTDNIQRVEVIRNGKFVYTQEPNAKTFDLDYSDRTPPAGRSYYYVRVQQFDRNLAWSSPIWLGQR